MDGKLTYNKILIFIILVFSSMLLITCDDKKFTNPWDEKSNLNPDEWAPTNFRIEKASSDTILLAWDYEDKNIEGFQIDRQVNDAEGQSPYKILPRDNHNFADTDFTSNVDSTFNYKISAYAGKIKSSSIFVDFIVGAPTVTTNQIINIRDTSAISGGNVLSDGGSDVTARGICWSTNQNPTITNSHTTDGTGIGSFTSSLNGLTVDILYYVRAYATNNAGTSYGSQVSFTTMATVLGSITDIDGNVYTTVIIGTQELMAENLRVTHYRNGEPIPNVTDNSQWDGLTTGAYCWYNNDESTYGNIYGGLYNWFTVVDSRNLCPMGWHIPSDDEWTTLTTFLGGESVAGGKMKETGTIHWNSPNTDATNESGFTGLPSGFRNYFGDFNNNGSEGTWWSSTGYGSNYAWTRNLYSSSGHVGRAYGFDYGLSKEMGFSVRCVRD
jgi:uncharacterized protein (TIGR02145 family)